MTATYKPALKASDDPAFSPSSGLFRTGGGGAPAFDINSIYGASDVGDFFESLVGQYTDAGTTPASSNGDLIQQWDGGRTTGTSLTISQGTASSRPELAADGTYTQATYFPGGALKWISDEAFANSITLWGIRFRLHAVNAPVVSTRACSLMASDFSPLSQGPGIMESRKPAVSGATLGESSTVVGDTSWHTMVVNYDGANFNLFYDDMGTADLVHASISAPSLADLRTGLFSTFTHGMYIHRMMCHKTYNAATPADVASWLEA